MELELVKRAEQCYLRGPIGKRLLSSPLQIMELLNECANHNTNLILLRAENLTPGFFDLSSREAGEILQKFSNYRIKAALVISSDQEKSRMFNEMSLETNRGNIFRIFEKVEQAEQWLLS
ncbi:DUF4180 domain-containing protein [bacterium]|nr:DUF4180 domain-containing protein [bacterium]